jgi:hypothetical protein
MEYLYSRSDGLVCSRDLFPQAYHLGIHQISFRQCSYSAQFRGSGGYLIPSFMNQGPIVEKETTRTPGMSPSRSYYFFLSICCICLDRPTKTVCLIPRVHIKTTMPKVFFSGLVSHLSDLAHSAFPVRSQMLFSRRNRVSGENHALR